ncbi:acyltransferase family protein [Hufsiella ginkgonis]|uniref:Acyltransferase family protein n=1 Tax=Hufsiella ginkgonis TaxID=2695274 RepID=A0A7K1Y309_9SPHI|nr:acyltransferase [Hufsiella ginkgonis]MXV17409.1 acyltransferase family protein [Hufsiella ginkgonis]
MKQPEFRTNNFDLLRLIAAIQVIVDHYFQHLAIPVSPFAQKLIYLFPGVPVFFIISGYLVSASYERNPALLTYFRNRALRIFPGLWCCILVTILVISLTGTSFLNKQTITWLPAQFAGFIYTPGFLRDYGFGSYNGSLWTIPIELQFYLLLPLVYFLVIKRLPHYWLYVLTGIFIGLNLVSLSVSFGERTDKLLTYSFFPHFYLFLAGVVFQRIRLYRLPFIFNKAAYWLTAYILFSLLLQERMPLPLFLVAKNLVLACCVISMAYTLPGAAVKLLRHNDISYGIYIYHGLILAVIVEEKLRSSINIFVVILLSCILAYISWIFIERPFILRKRKF